MQLAKEFFSHCGPRLPIAGRCARKASASSGPSAADVLAAGVVDLTGDARLAWQREEARVKSAKNIAKVLAPDGKSAAVAEVTALDSNFHNDMWMGG